jgi:hypothetical protein
MRIYERRKEYRLREEESERENCSKQEGMLKFSEEVQRKRGRHLL